MTTNPRVLFLSFLRELSASIPDRSRIDLLARALIAAEPRLSAIIRLALLDGYVRGARETARQLAADGARFNLIPASVAASMFPPVQFTIAGSGSAPPLITSLAASGIGSPNPNIRFPGIDAAFEWLGRRQLVTRSQWFLLDAQAQRAAFTVARFETTRAIEKIRDAVGESFKFGDGLESFRDKVSSVTEGIFSPAQVETLYRTNVGLAQAAGQRAVMENEWVADEFPYREWSATHDSRVRPEHLAMETHGQNGTAIYRSDDPMWETLWPPCSWNCRCNVIPLTVEDAARRGSAEARRWMQTGVRPANPVWARQPYPIVPPPGWPAHQGITAVV